MSSRKKEGFRVKAPSSGVCKSPISNALSPKQRKGSFEPSAFQRLNLYKESPAQSGRLKTLRKAKLTTERSHFKKQVHYSPPASPPAEPSMHKLFLQHLATLKVLGDTDAVNGSKLKQISQFLEQYVGLLTGNKRSSLMPLLTERQSSPAVPPKRVVPRLNFQSFSGQGFHQEFLNKAGEFSVSWRDALNLPTCSNA